MSCGWWRRRAVGVAWAAASAAAPAQATPDLRVLPGPMGAYSRIALLCTAYARPLSPPAPSGGEDGDFDPATGTATVSLKGGGICECGSVRGWRGNGRGFTRSAERADGMCRGFPGGAWQTPVYVSR